MASIQRITTELSRMAMLYRHPLDRDNELPAMAMAWTELCQGLTDEQFIAAVKAHLRESRFFPSPADILTTAEGLRPNRPPVLALEERPVTSEDMRETAVNSAMIVASLQGNMRARAYFDTADADRKAAIAVEVLGSRYADGDVSRCGGMRRVMQ